MTGYDCISQVLEIFETRLYEVTSGEILKTRKTTYNLISASELAEISGYSLWHFTRLFTSITGFTPKNYITARIFTECAHLITEPKGPSQKPLSVISNLMGFSNYTTFTRAFRNWSSTTPTSLRKIASLENLSAILQPPIRLELLNSQINNSSGISPTVSFKTDIAQILAKSGLEAELTNQQEQHITGLSFYMDSQLESFDKFWQLFSKRKNRIINPLLPEQYFQFTAWTPAVDGSNEDGNMSVMCALATGKTAVQNPIFVNRIIPSGLFLHVVHRAPMNEINKTYQLIYRNFFANTELKLLSGWEYQMYRDDITDIFIPVNTSAFLE